MQATDNPDEGTDIMLNQILRPVDDVRLRDARLNHTRCHVPGMAGRFPDLLPSLLIPHLITIDRLQRGSTVLSQQGRDVPLDMVLIRVGERQHLRIDALEDMCTRGLSFVLNGVDLDVPAIGALNATIERQWRVECWTNAYWSHGRASAFSPHADDHDVLILQLSGTKHWRCWGALEPYPIKPRAYVQTQLPAPAWEGPMNPGDALFVPRGDVHMAELASPSSLHLTVAVKPPQVRELPALLRTDAQNDVFSRQDIPVQPGADTTDLVAWMRRRADTFDPADVLAQWDQSRPPYVPNNLGVVAHDGTLLASALRRHIPAERLADGRYRITPAGWPFILTAEEWLVLDLLHQAGAMTLAQITASMARNGAAEAISSLIRKSLLFALEAADYGRASWHPGA